MQIIQRALVSVSLLAAGALLPGQAAAAPEDPPAPVASEKGPAPAHLGAPGFPKLGGYAAVGVPYLDVGKEW